MLRGTGDADIHPIALAIWMLILALRDRRSKAKSTIKHDQRPSHAARGA